MKLEVGQRYLTRDKAQFAEITHNYDGTWVFGKLYDVRNTDNFYFERSWLAKNGRRSTACKTDIDLVSVYEPHLLCKCMWNRHPLYCKCKVKDKKSKKNFIMTLVNVLINRLITKCKSIRG